MNKNFKKFISVILFAIALLSVFPAYASSTGSVATDESIGEDVVQGAKTEYSEVGIGGASTDAYLTVDDENVLVKVPTTVILNGEGDALGNYVGEYSVQVSGDIAGNEALVVQPKADTVSLSQEGKENKDATITQNKTVFTYEDLQNNEITEGTISANGLTAGSWNGSGTFDIQITSKMQYYSSVELAATDANALNYDNADCKTAQDENAVAALYVDKDRNEATIQLLKNESNIQSFTLNNDTTLDLSNKQLSFASEKGIIYKDDFALINGTVQSFDGGKTLSSSVTTNTLTVDNVDFISNISKSAKQSYYTINTSSSLIDIDNCLFTALGQGNSNYSVLGMSIINEKGLVNISNCNVEYNVESCNSLKFAQLFCNQNVTNLQANMYSDANSGVYGLQMAVNGNESTTKQTVLNNIKIKTVSETSPSGCVAVSGDYNVTATGLNLYADCLKNTYGSGMSLYENADLTINSSQNSPVNIFGKQWCIQTAPDGYSVINGGIYTSTNHTAYIGGNADIYDAEFYNTNRENYAPEYLDNAFGFYCGSSSQAEGCTVNIHNCVIGKPDSRSGITAKRNNGYTSPENINIYDTDIYGSLSYNYTTKTDIGNTKFNLYGDTHIWKDADTEWSKEEVSFAINNWKTSTSYNDDTQTYDTQYLGKYMINGYVANIDADTGEILDIYLTDDANVYDYRS